MVNISKTKRNFIWWHTLFAVISGALGAVILHFALPGHYFGGYPFIPIYFYFFGLFSIYAFDACRRHAPQRMLLLKMIKMILSLILVLIYCLAVREEARAFLLTFILFYLIYLVFETWFFFSFELNQKRKKKNKKKNETVA